jgi:hypothetical protein
MSLSTLLCSEAQKKVVGSFECPDKYNLLVIDCNSAPTEGIQTLHEKLLKGINSETKIKKLILIAPESHPSADKFRTGEHNYRYQYDVDESLCRNLNF